MPKAIGLSSLQILAETFIGRLVAHGEMVYCYTTHLSVSCRHSPLPSSRRCRREAGQDHER